MTLKVKTEIKVSPTSTPSRWAPPRWAPVTAMATSLAGLGVSGYLTIAHYSGSVTLACPDTGVINCEKVTTSPQSVTFGIPVAVLGLAFFAAMLVLNGRRLWNRSDLVVRVSRLGLAIAGVGFAIYLIYTELFTVHAICLWCTTAHVLAFALFAEVIFGEWLAPAPPD
jgi:uncharacterized membrane protein